MTILRKTVSLLAVFSIIPAAWAVTMRPSAISTTSGAMTATAANGASRRLAVTTAHKLLGNNYAPGNHAPQTDATMGDVECVEEYSRCLAEDDACGSDFEECTSDVLFHAQMPDCVSTLMQCSDSGITTLFGDDATFNNLNTAVKGGIDEDGRIIDFLYPTDDSVIGQKIIAAEIKNRYTTEQCIRNYTRCLERDDVCGAKFELCTNTKDFKNQALLCDSKLARCEAEAVYELFGSKTRYQTVDDADLKSSDAVLSKRISDGASYVAINAVDSCYALVDNCFSKACASNPFRCLVGTSVNQLLAADMVTEAENNTNASGGAGDSNNNASDGKDGTNKTPDNTGDNAKTDSLTTNNEVNRFLRTSCADTIGLNKACHMTVFGKNVKEKDLADSDKRYDIIDEVYSTLYDTRISYIQSSVATIAQDFDSHAKQECLDVIQKCAIRSCGGGSGAACYKKVMGKSEGERSLASGTAYNDIKDGCSAIVNTNPYCMYAYATLNDKAVYSYSFSDKDAFSKLFPKGNGGDPIGAVASTNALLFSTYNDVALANMKRACQQTVTDCVKSVCGADFSDCYLRNKSAKSITDEKVDGSLDYTIVLGKCLPAVKQDKNCDEHRAIAQLDIVKEEEDYVNSWGNSTSVRNAWVSVGEKYMDNGAPYAADKSLHIIKTNEKNKEICTGDDGVECVCGEPYGDDNKLTCPSNTPVLLTYADAAANNLFYELVADLNAEAQGEYRRQRLKVQKMCLDMNSVGGNSAQPIYRWVEPKTNTAGIKIKIGDGTSEDSYYTSGLRPSEVGENTDDVYNGYCAVRVTLGSDDIWVNEALTTGKVKSYTQSEHTKTNDKLRSEYDFEFDKIGVDIGIEPMRYFAIGDAFMCGSWLTQSQLIKLAEAAEMVARKDAQKGQATEWRTWAPIIGAVGLGTGGVFLGDALQHGNIFGKTSGVTSPKDTANNKATEAKNTCIRHFDNAKKGVTEKTVSSAYQTHVDNGIKVLEKHGITVEKSAYKEAIAEYKEAVGAYTTATEGNAKKAAAEVAADAAADAAAELKSHIDAFKSQCNNIKPDKWCGDGYKLSDDGKECVPEDGAKGWFKRDGGKLLGGVISAAGGAWLGYEIADGILDSQLDEAGRAAYQEFMDTVGSKIHCYIGSQKVASFGQLIETSMD